MSAPERLYLTPAYSPFNHGQSDAVRNQLWQDAAWAYDSAYEGNYEAAVVPLKDWGINNKTLVNYEAKLVVCFKASLMAEAYRMLPSGMKPSVFRDWIWKVYLSQAVLSVYGEWNNRGAWGLLGRVLANDILGLDQRECMDRFDEIIAGNTEDDGLVKDGPERTNSGMWYSYFFLAPLLRVAQLLPVEKYMLYTPISWFWEYVEHPETWPYKPAPWWTPQGAYQRLFQACAKDVELPRKNDWPGDLYYVAGKEFNHPEWVTWGTGPKYWTNIFRYG